MITATQQGPRQFDTPVSFKNYQIPKCPPPQVRVEVRAQHYGLTELLEEGDYVYEVRRIVDQGDWKMLCEFHEVIKQNHNTFDETPQKKEIDAALYHLRPNLYQWLIELKYKEESKVQKKKLTKEFIYKVLCLDYSFAKQCARTATKPDSPFLSKFNWRNLTKTSEVKSYTPSIKLQYTPLPKADIIIFREELEESDSDTSVSDTELGETETRALEAEKESRARKRKSRCSASEPPNSASISKKRKAYYIAETDSDSDADNAYVNSLNGNGIETDVNSVTASDTKNSLTTSNEKQSARQTSRPVSLQVPAPVIKPQKMNEVVEDIDIDLDQLLEKPIDKASIVKSPADTPESPDSLKKWLDSIGKLKEEFNESMELNELTEVNKSLWNSILELVELVNAQYKSINMYQLFLKKIKLHFQVPYFKSVREDERLQKKYSYLLEQYISLYVKYNELRADHAELEDEDNEACKALNIDMQDLMAQVSEAIEELNVYKQETIETQEELQRLELQTEVEKRQKLQKDYDELVKEYQRSIEKSKQIEKAHSKLNAELKLAYNKWREDHQKRKNAEGKINELKLEMERLTKNLRKIHSESYEKLVACSTAEKKFTQAESVLIKANEKAQAEILGLKEQNEKLQKRSETLENEKSRLESELERMRNSFNPRLYNP